LAVLHGRVTAHHRFLLRPHLDHLDAVDAASSRSTGIDMSRFPTAAELISCAGLCPKNEKAPASRAPRA
jgi:transposase